MEREAVPKPAVRTQEDRSASSRGPAKANVEAIPDGGPLPASLRRPYEKAFRRDFSGIGVHTQGQAPASMRSRGANAATAHSRIVFGADRFEPTTARGQRLLAHEFAHVVQQREGEHHGPVPRARVLAAEAQAEAAAVEVIAGRTPAALDAIDSGVVLHQAASAPPDVDDAVDRINDLLEYHLLDWAITDEDAVRAFNILRGLSQADRVSALGRIHVQRLQENLPQQYQAELAVMLVAGRSRGASVRNMRSLLSRSFWALDWAITDEDAHAVVQMLEAMGPQERDRSLEELGPPFRRRLWEEAPTADRRRLDQMWQEFNDRVEQRQLTELTPPPPRPESPTERKANEFRSYLRALSDPDPLALDAAFIYWRYVDREAQNPEYLTITAPELWTRSLHEASAQRLQAVETMRSARVAGERAAAETRAELQRFEDLQAFIHGRIGSLGAMNDVEAGVQSDIIRRFVQYAETPAGRRELRRGRYLDVYERLGRDVITPAVDAARRRAASAPQGDEARKRTLDSFHAAADRLLAYRRRFPYVIPIPSEGRDLLVWGHPAQERLFDSMAADLLTYAYRHYSDADFTLTTPTSVLAAFTAARDDEILQAALEPLVFESILRTDLDAGTIAESFVTTLGKGLLIAAVAGIVVGAEVLTAGQVTWLFVGYGAYSGVNAYSQRRDEITQAGVDVPPVETVLAAAGDVIGLSEFLEGMTGVRFGTRERLSGQRASQMIGSGAGSMSALMFGSRAYRMGHEAGAGYRASNPRGAASETAGSRARSGAAEEGGPRPPGVLPGPAEHFPFGSGSEPLPTPAVPNRVYRIMSMAEAAEALRTQRLPAGAPGASGTKFVSLDSRYAMLFREKALAEVEAAGNRVIKTETRLADLERRLREVEAQGDATRAAELRQRADALRATVQQRTAQTRAQSDVAIGEWYDAPGQSIVVEIELAPGAMEHMLNRAVTEQNVAGYGGKNVYVWKFERGYGQNIGVPAWQLRRFNDLVLGIRFHAERGATVVGPRTRPAGSN